jgi:hypothetical protein
MSNYSIVRADLERDRDAILAVWERNLDGSPALNAAKFDWYYRSNPAGPGRCWLLLAEPGGQVVGTAGLGMRRVKVGDEVVRAGLVSDFAVDKEHRSLQPALRLQKAVLGAFDDDLAFIYGLPNEQSVGVFRRLGYEEVGSVERHAKVLRAAPYLRQLPGPAQGWELLSAPVDWALRAASPETWQRARGLAVEETATFDSRFDALWQRASRQAVVAGERSADFLRWRYSACPLRQHVTLGIRAGEDDRLLGYAVFYREEDHVHCVDLLAEDDERALELLFAALIRHVRSGGATSISLTFSASGSLAQRLARFGFIPRSGERPAFPILAFWNPRRSGSAAAELMKQWRFLPGDEDIN